jgi:hypothetical protein
LPIRQFNSISTETRMLNGVAGILLPTSDCFVLFKTLYDYVVASHLELSGISNSRLETRK